MRWWKWILTQYGSLLKWKIWAKVQSTDYEEMDFYMILGDADRYFGMVSARGRENLRFQCCEAMLTSWFCHLELQDDRFLLFWAIVLLDNSNSRKLIRNSEFKCRHMYMDECSQTEAEFSGRLMNWWELQQF